MNIESVKLGNAPQRPAEIGAHQQTPRSAPASPKATETASSLQQVKTDPKSQEAGNQKLSVEDAVKRLTDFVAPTNSEINFSIDEESGVRVVKVLDSQSKEVIRQFPSEEAIQLAMALDKLQGLFVKDKA